MIGWLRGDVVEANAEGSLLLNVGGVGYEVVVTPRLARSVVVGDEQTLYVHTHVRDDAIILYGFVTPDEKQTFTYLVATPGVGPTTAVGALSTFTPHELATAIAIEDVTALATIPGIGRKTAARLILELSGKLPTLAPSETAVATLSSDLEGALQGFGYSLFEIRAALRGVSIPTDESEALRLALRQLGSR